MSDPSLIFLQLLPVQQKGTLILYDEEAPIAQAPAVIGHVDRHSAVVLSICAEPNPPAKQAEFRFLAKSGIYALRTREILLFPQENGTLMLTMLPPFEMTFQQQREFIRVEPHQPIPLQFDPIYPDDYRSGVGTIKDLSGNGLRFVTDEFVARDSVLAFSFPHPESGHMINGVGQIARKEFMGGETIASLRFLEIHAEDRRAIVAYTAAEQLRMAEAASPEKRRFARIFLPSPLPARIREQEDGPEYLAEIGNLGGGGMLVIARNPFPDAAVYQVAFSLPNERDPLCLTARIADGYLRNHHLYYHMEFVNASMKERRAIIHFVLQHQLALLEQQAQNLKSH